MYSVDNVRQRRGAAAKEAADSPVGGDASFDAEAEKGHAAQKAAALAAAAAEAPAARSKFDTFIERNERWMPFFVLAVALFTRFYRLSQPNGVVFDESHFGRFTNQYTAGTYYFDIHPPLGKLVFWLMGKTVGYNLPDARARPYLGLETDCRYEHISEDYHPECKYVWLRVVSAAHSSATVLLMYLISRRWSGSVWGGLLGGGLLLFDMLNHIEGRLILMDVQLIFWCTAALWAAIKWWDRLNEDAEARDERRAGLPTKKRVLEGWQRYAWAAGVGVACGNAFSVKMTGLATPAIIGLETALGIWFLRRPAPWRDMFCTLGAGLAVYIFYFAVHFKLLFRHGDGDEEFMTVRFQSTLLENRHYDPSAVWEGFWWTLVTLNVRMVVHNANILEPHPWQSKWHEWVLNQRGVSYYGKDLPYTYTAHMYLIGNHAVHYAVIAAFALFALMALAYLRLRHFPGYAALAGCKPFFAQCSYCAAVYALNLAPYVGVARSTFIYHYMPALVYGELLAARVVEQIAGPRHMAAATKLVLGVVGLVWLYYTPWIYGFALTNDGHERRRWLPRWN